MGAALVATGVTGDIILVVGAIGDIPPNPFWHFLGAFIGLFVFPLFAALFGFVGAFLFLGAGFLFVRPKWGRRGYACAGALSGLIHTFCGFALRMLDYDLVVARGWGTAYNWAIVGGGFALTSQPVREIAIATFPASLIAGALAGLAYAKVVGIRDRRHL